jgi:hypothetical protein
VKAGLPHQRRVRNRVARWGKKQAGARQVEDMDCGLIFEFLRGVFTNRRDVPTNVPPIAGLLVEKRYALP